MVDAQARNEGCFPVAGGLHFLFRVIQKKTGFEKLNDGGVFDGGIEVAHDEVGIVLLLSGFDFFKHQFSGLHAGRLALVIPVRIVNVDW